MVKYTSKFTGIEIDERLSKVNEEFTSEEKEKLAALENYDDSEILAAVEDKVDKVEGKGLSTNDFTNEEKNKLSALENYDDSGITKSIEDLEENKANKSEVYSKEETDTKITEKVAEIVAGAPEEFNTLKEMSDWLTEHEDSAATMNTAILKNKEDIAANTEAIEENKSDILSAENAIAINRATLGTQCINIFDGYLRQGGIQSTDGVFYVANDMVASGNFIKVSRNATISISRTMSGGYLVWRFYDKDKNYIGYGSEENVRIISGGSGLHMPSTNSKFACYKLVNPNITYAKFVEMTSNLSNVYTIVEGEYTEDTMPAYEPYKPSLQEQINALVAEIAELKANQTTVSE